jgi:hypothetical protein
LCAVMAFISQAWMSRSNSWTRTSGSISFPRVGYPLCI